MLIFCWRVSDLLAICTVCCAISWQVALMAKESVQEVSASSVDEGFSAMGAIDGDRVSVAPASLWKGKPGEQSWWWQIRFAEPRRVGSILQVHSDRERAMHNGPEDYVWQFSQDGIVWETWSETEIKHERRLFRIHRLHQARQVRCVRLLVRKSYQEAPALREVEFYPESDSAIPFPDWIMIIHTEPKVTVPPEAPHLFVNLIRECAEWKHCLFQQIPYVQVDKEFVAAEPRPLCALLTGSTTEWCQVKPETWRGFEEVLKEGQLPIWGACGGAQVMAILWEHGTNHPWDCPRCRDPNHPLSPVYTHIGHTGEAPCGDYSKNIGERGKYRVRIVARDPVFEGVPELFETMEAHYGQIDYVPQGWVHIVTKGPEGLTENQCLRIADRYIYAAQFHIELPGTPEPSQRIMSNFLRLAREWGGYNPNAKPVPPPEPFDTSSTAEGEMPATAKEKQ